MSKIVERVAEAIHAACSANGIDTKGAAWDHEVGSVRELYYNIARAAIEAMREPTSQMRSAGEDVDLSVDFDEPGRSIGFCAAEVYRTMIDAALKESP